MPNPKVSTALLDANVLYPAPVRDLLLNIANEGLFNPRWTNEIHEEWIRNLVVKRPDLIKAKLKNAQVAMDSAFPNANIKNYKTLIEKLVLPDKNDRHVLAAAIKGKADIIITFNTKDFPLKYLNPYNIEVKSPDTFVSHIMDTNKFKVLEAFYNQVNSLKNPPQSIRTVLATLEKCGMNASTEKLRTVIGNI